MLVAACAGTAEPAAQLAPLDVTLRNATALLRPVPDASELLGRAVEQRADGKLTIRNERMAGCLVEVRRTPTELREHNRSYVRGVAALQADYLNVGHLNAESTEVRQVEIDVHQTELLQAKVAGPCGEDVITTVYVGHGVQQPAPRGGRVSGRGGPRRESWR